MTVGEAIIVFNADNLVGQAIVREMLDPQHRHNLTQQYGHVYATVRDVTHAGDLPALGVCLVEMGENPDERKLVECLKQCKITTAVLVPDCASKQFVNQAKKIISAAKQSNIERFVLMSRLGAEDTSVEVSKNFSEIENSFKQTGISTAAIVRIAPLIQSLFWFRKMLTQKKLMWPLKEDCRFSSVSLRDISNFIVYELLHGNRMRRTGTTGTTTTTTTGSEPHCFKLTGSSVCTPKEICQLFQHITGSQIEYDQIDRKEFERYMREKEGLPEMLVKETADTFELISKGRMSTISDDLKKATGKEPIKVDEWLNKHKDLFEMRQGITTTTYTRI